VQATAEGLFLHQMAGIDPEKSRQVLGLPEGWDAVTTRRLSAEIEYSQPVLYKHFSNMEAIAHSVAVDGFRELAESLANARGGGAAEPEHALRRIAHAYIDFALTNPAVYDAMFTRATTLHFAASDTPPELSAAFVALRDAVTAVADTADADTATETCGPRCTAWPLLAEAGDFVADTIPNGSTFSSRSLSPRLDRMSAASRSERRTSS